MSKLSKSKLSKSKLSKSELSKSELSKDKKLATPTNLSSTAPEKIAKALNPVVADAFALYLKTKNFHWHLYGPKFRDLHLLFDEQAAEIIEMIDVLAERVRKVGGITVKSLRDVANLTCIKDDEEAGVSAEEMVKRLMNDNKQAASQMKKAHKVCQDCDDVASTSLLEEYIDAAERRVWFLFELQA